jgi:hypothetical protein
VVRVPIIFGRSDYLDNVPKLGQYPLIVSSIVTNVKLNQVIIDRGSSLNILFLKTLNQMGLSKALLCPSQAPFHGIVSGAATTPIGQITLPVTFRTRENFCTENLHFEVADFKMAHNAFLRRPALSKFMVIPHYAYLVLKMPGPHGVISIRGDTKQAYDYDWESCEMSDRLMASTELQDLRQALVESPPDPIMPRAETSKTSI